MSILTWGTAIEYAGSMRIGELIWAEDRVAHIAEHGIMSRIPQMDSIEELTRFWDTHDVTDFEEELEEVKEPVFERGAEAVMRIRLPAKQAEALKRLAQSRGMDEADLIEEWVNEKLRAS
jgi:predicted DNA binding CopG/RHH family protein